jgi:hypothetical protein
MTRARSYYDVLTDAIADFTEHGYDSQARLDFWLEEIRRAAEGAASPAHILEDQLRKALETIYRRMVDRAGLLKLHKGVSKWTLQKVAPHLRAELDRRILASANLIKMNRKAAIEKTLQRFAGWSTSIPVGGTKATDKRETKTDIRKSLAQLPFAERRVAIDQGHKFVSSLSDILACDGGAIAGQWDSNWRQPGYNYRKDHKERDGKIYLIRDTWATKGGLVKTGNAGYMDEITMPSEEVFCQCSYVYLYDLEDLPEGMLTVKGKNEIVRKK